MKEEVGLLQALGFVDNQVMMTYTKSSVQNDKPSNYSHKKSENQMNGNGDSGQRFLCLSCVYCNIQFLVS